MQPTDKISYPSSGCIVEFLHGNLPTLAIVQEKQAGKLRLYTQTKREIKLPENRLLPWAGPQYSASLDRAAMDSLLEEHKARREQLGQEVNIEEIWTLTEGEVEKASAGWFVGLFHDTPTIDHEAAMGHMLLKAKTHFRFTPPNFEIFNKETVEKRLATVKAEQSRERIISAGTPFFQTLWDIFLHKGKLLPASAIPEKEIATQLQALLMEQIAAPDNQDTEVLWKQLTKGLPADPFLSLSLAKAWGIIPEHYNYLLNRIAYDTGDTWFTPHANEVQALIQAAKAEIPLPGRGLLPPVNDTLPSFISIDASTTKDRDDAFHVCKLDTGAYQLTVALACPALYWPFGTSLDKVVQRRSTSLYLPEGDEHMLPPAIGWELFSLEAGYKRPALVLSMQIDQEGTIHSFSLQLAKAPIAANFCWEDCEPFFQSFANPTDENLLPSVTKACSFAPVLHAAYDLARLLQKKRIAAGAVIIERPDPKVILQNTDNEIRVTIECGEPTQFAHFAVGEIMLLANASLARWAIENSIPFLYRTQDVALPKEFYGVWSAPQDISRIVKSLPPATLEMHPKRHAGLGLDAYTTATSPIRRYADLLNQGQIVTFLDHGKPLFNTEELTTLMPLLQSRAEAVAQVQRFRPRYWKLVFFRQQGDKKWWKGVIAEENDAFVTVSLPWAQILVRGRRKFFDEKVYPGLPVEIRLGKVNPLLNEISILETRESEEDYS